VKCKGHSVAAPGARILIADDNTRLLRVLKAVLEGDGHEVILAEDGHQALERARQARPALAILDVNMPGLDGFAVCDRLRAVTDAPIIFLTARTGEVDVLRGLSLGADDYLTKPFSLAELKARVDAKLRRSGARGLVGFQDGFLEIDLEHGRVRRDGEELSLSPKQYQLLAHLVRHQGTIVPHARLLEEVWGEGYEGERGYLALYVRYLRERLERDPSNPAYIRTHHGLGYSFLGTAPSALA
jgi:DNA-binding response OmpR family regulator